MSSEIWSVIDAGLQDIYARVQSGQDLRSEEVQQAFAKLHIYVVAAASSILDSPALSLSDRDPETVARRWRQRMEQRGFQNYRPGRGSLLTYARTILWNLCRADSRKWRLRRTKHIPFGRPAPSWEPSAEASKREWTEKFRKAVRRLPKKYRRAFLLRYFFELSSEVAAKRCGLKCIATFDTWCFEARKRLKQQVGYPEWNVDRPVQRNCRAMRHYVWKHKHGHPHLKDQHRG